MPLLRPRVVTASDVSHRPPHVPGHGEPVPREREDPYVSKLIKYIPAEIVAAYMFVSGILESAKSPWSAGLCLATVVFLAVITPLWIRYATTDATHAAPGFQMYSALFAFLVWVFAVGGPWKHLLPEGYETARPAIGSVLVMMASFLMPLLEKIFEKPPTVVGTV